MKRETKKKTHSPKREFTREYKEEALKLWESSGWRSKEKAESLGIDPQYLPKCSGSCNGLAALEPLTAQARVSSLRAVMPPSLHDCGARMRNCAWNVTF